MPRALAAAERGMLALTPQPADGVSYAAKISKDETRIDWAKPAHEVHNHLRGLSPFPGAWFELDGVRIKALRSTLSKGSGAPGTTLDDSLTIACGDSAIRLTGVQRAGKQPMSAQDFLRGTVVKAGARVRTHFFFSAASFARLPTVACCVRVIDAMIQHTPAKIAEANTASTNAPTPIPNATLPERVRATISAPVTG